MSAATPSVLAQRRSIRKYLPQPVPDEVVRDILTEARWAPSATNTQSTYVYVLSGEPFAQFKADMRKYAEDNVPPVSDIDMAPKWTPVYQARQQEMFAARSSFCEEAKTGGTWPEDAVNPMAAAGGVFGAPALLILAFDKDISLANGIFDGGILAMAITVAAQERGLGTCIAGSLVRYAELVHKHVPGLDDKNVLIAIALGYPDVDAPINQFLRTRIPVDEFTTFVK